VVSGQSDAEPHGGFRDPAVRGALVGVVFGTVWALVGVTGLVDATPARVVGYVIVVVLAVVVAVAAVRMRAAADRSRPRPERPGDARRTFVLVNVVQAVLIVGAAVVLNRLGLSAFIAPAACVVVGLHFLPLAGLFAVPLYRLTGAVLVVVGVVGAVLAGIGVAAPIVLTTVGLGAAVTLWSTSLLPVRRAA
jgi:hypothetical protein